LLGDKGGLVVSNLFTLISTALLCFFDAGTDQVLLYAFVLFLAKSGASLSFGFAYAIHIDLFPNHFLISSYGICNLFCRGLTIFAPIVAEIPDPLIPILFLNASALAGFLASALLKMKPEEK
jgi:hypothetical protein